MCGLACGPCKAHAPGGCEGGIAGTAAVQGPAIRSAAWQGKTGLARLTPQSSAPVMSWEVTLAASAINAACTTRAGASTHGCQ